MNHFSTKIFCIIVAIVFEVFDASAQVKIGNNPASINLNSLFELESTNKGMLMPRVDLTGTANASPLSTHVAGMVIYNTATAADVTPGFYYNNGTVWVATKQTTNHWSFLGNAGTADGSNFIGTTDNVPLTFKVNNQKAGRIDDGGPTFFGYQAGNVNAADNITGIGYRALYSNTTGTDNTAYGYAALYANISGSENTATGYTALYSNTTGNNNTAIGFSALNSNTTGNENTASGYAALYANTGGLKNTAIGANTLNANTSGSENTATGYQSLLSNTIGSYNTATGFSSLQSNTIGINNTANGYLALFSNTSGSNNTANGYRSLYYNTVGSYNTANGYWALSFNTEGSFNIAHGYQALATNTTGDENTATGMNALLNNSTGNNNTADGSSALAFNTTGDNNTAIGNSALRNNLVGINNAAIGTNSLYNNTASNNVAIGFDAGGSQTTGDNCTFLGYSAEGSAGSYSNASAIGYQASVTASNRVRIGNSAITQIGGYQPWTDLSDARFKKNISEDVTGLDFILKLRPVTYNMEVNKLAAHLKEDELRDGSGAKVHIAPDALTQRSRDEKEQILYTGFIAQEVEVAANSIGYDFSGVVTPETQDDLYGLNYSEFVVPLVKAMQEQQVMIEQQNIRIELLINELALIKEKQR